MAHLRSAVFETVVGVALGRTRRGARDLHKSIALESFRMMAKR